MKITIEREGYPLQSTSVPHFNGAFESIAPDLFFMLRQAGVATPGEYWTYYNRGSVRYRAGDGGKIQVSLGGTWVDSVLTKTELLKIATPV